MPDDIPALPGTYLLVFTATAKLSITVGRLGRLELVPGCYIYIGSAFGPGGLRARVKHHCAISHRPHWHLDYVRPQLCLQQVWYSIATHRLEHAWAESMYYTMQMQIPLPGLGASDCQCHTHFYYTAERPDNKILHNALNGIKNTTALEMIKFQ
jgi:Uri superfamily endonuclease